MIDRKSSKYRTFLIVASCLLLGCSAVVAFKMVGKKLAIQRLAKSDDAYARGTASYEAKNFAQARDEFDEAAKEAAMGLQDLDQQLKGQAGDAAANETKAKLVWNYIRATIDRGYATGEAEGKPLLTQLDTSTNEKYRSLLQLPDANERLNLGLLLRQAAQMLPKNEEVQRACLRTEITLARTDWPLVKLLCDQIIALSPTDTRAQFLLAYHEFEQPGRDGLFATDDKRDLARVLKAREAITMAQKAKNFPAWRTLGLEARILHWLIARPMDQQVGFTVEQERARLKAILSDAKTGLPGLVARQEGYDSVTRFDLQGMADLFTYAAEGTLAEPNGNVAATLQTFLQTIHTLEKMTLADGPLGELTDAAIAIAERHADVAKMRESVTWGQALDTIDGLAKKLSDRKAQTSKRCAKLGTLFLQEGKPRATHALHWASEGIRHAPNEDTKADLHLVCMNLKIAEGRPLAEIRVHAEALRDSNSKKGQAIAGFYEAKTALEAGKFELARRWFEEVVRRPEGGDLVVRTYVILPDLYMASGRPIEAAAYARELDKGYERVTSASRELQVWASDYYRTQQDVVALVVQTQYEAARQKIERERREHPDREITRELTRLYEDTAFRAMERLSGKSDANLVARLALCEFLHVARPAELAKELDSLRADYPDSVAIARFDGAIAEAANRAKIDERMKKFSLKEQQATLFAEWLFLTARSSESLAYLDGLSSNDGKALAAFLKKLPTRDHVVDALFARAFVIDPVLPHHEREAAQHVKAAVLAVANNKHVEAGQALRRVSEHVTYKHVAREGLKVILARLQQEDPIIAKKLSVEWLP